jgi:spermidine/putrescine transport system substrate-binding protein
MLSILRCPHTFPYRVLLFLAIVYSVCACGPAVPSKTQVSELVLRTWEDDMPADLFVGFTQKTGIQVRFESYPSQEDAVADLQAGKSADIVVMDSRFIPSLIECGCLRVIDRSNVPNFKFISSAFRDLSFDPGNRHSAPYDWGTTGIVFRRDLAGRDIKKWSDLWDPNFAGKVGLWESESREEIGLTLKMLGFSANSENPEELAAAMAKLQELQPRAVLVETIDPYTAVPGLLDGRLIVSQGYAYDGIEGRKKNPQIQFVLPAEGALLWSEHFVIPASSTHPREAERLLNYLLEPQVMASIANYNHYAPAHDGALDLIDPQIRDDPLVFPSNDLLTHAEIIYPISAAAEQRYQAAWKQFIATFPQKAP